MLGAPTGAVLGDRKAAVSVQRNRLSNRFQAEHQKEGRKRNVTVKGFVHDIKVFEGEFKTVITERHVLRLDLMKNVE